MSAIISTNLNIRVGIKHEPTPVTQMRPREKRLDDLVKERLESANQYKRVILSVEDHKDTGDLLEILLGMHGYNVNSLNGEADVLRLVMDEHFDLYLIGDLWPVGSNIELAKKIRKVNRYTPLIFHSAQSKPCHAEWGLAAGGQAFCRIAGGTGPRPTASCRPRPGPRPWFRSVSRVPRRARPGSPRTVPAPRAGRRSA